MSKSTIIFADGADRFAVEVNNLNTVNLASQLHNLRLYTKKAGVWATKFLNSLSGTSLVPLNQYNTHNYVVNVLNGVVALYKNNLSGRPVFEGDFASLTKWTEASHELQSAVGKLIAFTYKSDSGTRRRYVKLASVEGNGNKTLLRGKDVSKDEFRAYRIGNIVGEIQVLED
jgi:hypothetical protein